MTASIETLLVYGLVGCAAAYLLRKMYRAYRRSQRGKACPGCGDCKSGDTPED